MYSIKHCLLFTGLVMLSSTVAAQSRPSVSSNAARITTLESEVQTIKNEVATIELTPGADGQDGVGAIEGTEFGQMQFWDGDAWQTIQSPDANSADAQVLTFLNGAFTWQTPASSGPTTYEVGDTGPAGGVVFWVDEAGTGGLEAAPADVVLDGTSGFRWGCYGESVAGTSTAINTGAANTAAILAHFCSTTPTYGGTAHEAALAAAGYQYNGFSDWFLPSKDELNALYQNKSVVDGFRGFYWSSSQDNSRYAWAHSSNGTQYTNFKNSADRVRAVRSF